jgi:hypothetical protein
MQEIVDDAENMVPLVCFHHDSSTGPKPCSRKFMGFSYLADKYWVFGGFSVELLNDMRSYNYHRKEWELTFLPQQDEDED